MACSEDIEAPRACGFPDESILESEADHLSPISIGCLSGLCSTSANSETSGHALNQHGFAPGAKTHLIFAGRFVRVEDRQEKKAMETILASNIK
jgi:hypothetical protein